ncbi:MAG: hypothetical protein H6641_01975 [Caldilineaceae bacterium]|nr:hypothetical protein [Caldilineaceae bacterium]
MTQLCVMDGVQSAQIVRSSLKLRWKAHGAMWSAYPAGPLVTGITYSGRYPLCRITSAFGRRSINNELASASATISIHGTGFCW